MTRKARAIAAAKARTTPACDACGQRLVDDHHCNLRTVR
jgi:hypothetical protein